MTRVLQPCGTRAAYKRHLRRYEEACPDCKRAMRDAKRARLEAEALYTPAEVAARWGVTPQTIGNWTRDGRIPPTAVVRLPSGRLRYKATAIDALVKEHTS
jgi:hypothetical protein